MQSFLKKYRKGNVAVTLAYSPSKELTLIDMEVPEMVPLYIDFDPDYSVGSVRLATNEDGIYAMFELTTPIRMRFRELISSGTLPGVILAISEGERFAKNGINFLRNGVIVGATLHDRVLKEDVNEHA